MTNLTVSQMCQTRSVMPFMKTWRIPLLACNIKKIYLKNLKKPLLIISIRNYSEADIKMK